MKYYHALLTTLLLCFCTVAEAQKTFPVNGPHHILSASYALIHATVYTDADTRIENATILIKDGKIENAGTGIAIPPDARVIDMRGKVIYPGFVDLYSDYGINFTPGKKVNHSQQFLTSKQGPFNWNEAIRSEFDAAAHFAYSEAKVKTLRECGFGTVLSGLQDGICRGTSALVLTAPGPEHELIIQAKAASGFSFKKGSSTQDYPSSLMGSIALIRQTYLDAKWYVKQDKEKNISLQAFNELIQLPAVFSVDNKLSALRADRVGDEFEVSYIIKGAGDEYQRADEIKAAKVSLIIPINFPKPYEVEDPLDAAQVSTTDLKHWEMAPANAMLLAKKEIPFAITASGCENSQEFLKNLRKVVQYGLDEKSALKALTETPAKLIKAEKQLGAIRKGMYANLVVCSGNLFDKQTLVLENWSGGKRTILSQSNEQNITGIYKVELQGYEALTLMISGEANKPAAAFISTDTLKGTLTESFGVITFTFKPRKQSEDIVRINAWVVEKDSNTFPMQVKSLHGTAVLADGTIQNFHAQQIGNAPVQPKKNDSSHVVPTYGEVLYPFTDYGKANILQAEDVVFKNATVWSNEKDGILKETDVAISKGKITAIGKNISLKGAREINATGMHLTNGIIDEHSHIAIAQGVNECTQAVTSEVRIGDVVNSEDINVYRQLAGGVTSAQLLHGSCNPIGGQSALIKLRWGKAPELMKIEGSDGFIKFALGENVKQSNFGDQANTRYPQTRMGVEQTVYDAFIRAKEYEADLKKDKLTRRDLELDAVVEILRRKRFITCHSYVQSEINMLMHAGDSLGFKVNTFTHILEGYKLADKMKAHGANASTFADWWAYKYEVIEAIPYNASIMQKVGVNVAINSDDAEMGRRLNQEAAKSIKYGGMAEEDAWKMVTLNPARMLHLDAKLGSIKEGKDADLVLWNNNPLSVYAIPQYTFVDGICYFSIETDKALRDQVRKERQRIIQKLIAAKQGGEKTEKHISTEDENYHCED